MEKIGQRTKSTRPGPPHTGRPHGRLNLAKSKTTHRKRPILRILRHSKAYKYTLKEEEKGHTGKEAGNCSRKAD
ncbi:hypothetical protein F383_38420 [Gossypium arboreum]|uniref:Uncharacterized protein n=1 Tax=Gossypium arboreum TaxID=29729 RepID=A0A0B0MBB1_GOSAR|nr:hypothetical protein F383_38420 [Gossypium arboreum]